MNKLYTIFLGILFSSIAFAQNGANKGFENQKTQLTRQSDISKIIPTPPQQNKKAVGDTIWSEDFTNGFPAGWSVYDSTGNNYNWVINNSDINNQTSIPPGYTNTSAIASESGGNHMLLFGDEYNRVQQANTSTSVELNSFFQTSAINLTGQSAVTVNFQQKFNRCCANAGIISNMVVSTDPTFTTNVEKYDIVNGESTGAPSQILINMSINISDFVGGLNGDIYLRFHVESGTTHYYWMIDDIYITESGLNNIVTDNGFYGLNGYQYTKIPVSQVQPIDFYMEAYNTGSVDQTGTNLKVDIYDGISSIFNDNSTNTTINSFGRDTFELNNFWIPPTNQLNIPYTVSLDIFSDSLDETPQNNSIIFPPFEITSAILALDDYSATPGNGGGNTGPNGVTEYEAGNQFDIVNQNEDLYAIQMVTGPNTPVGTFIDVVIYQIDFTVQPEGYIELWRSVSYAITTADIGTVHNFYDTPGTPIAALTTGESYFVAVHSAVDYEFGVSGINPSYGTPSARHSGIRYPNMGNPNANSSFGLTNTPMIRLNFDATVGIDTDNEATSFSLSPNPTSGKFTISINSEEINTLFITNTVGQEILSKTINTIGKIEEEISLKGYDKGIYFITLKSKTGNQTSKLILE